MNYLTGLLGLLFFAAVFFGVIPLLGFFLNRIVGKIDEVLLVRALRRHKAIPSATDLPALLSAIRRIQQEDLTAMAEKPDIVCLAAKASTRQRSRRV
jgi:hypothetical protein